MLINGGLLTKIWLKALLTIYYIINKLSTKTLQKKILYKAWYKGKFDISNLYIYRYDEYVVDYKSKIK